MARSNADGHLHHSYESESEAHFPYRCFAESASTPAKEADRLVRFFPTALASAWPGETTSVHAEFCAQSPDAWPNLLGQSTGGCIRAAFFEHFFAYHRIILSQNNP